MNDFTQNQYDQVMSGFIGKLHELQAEGIDPRDMMTVRSNGQ